MPGVVNTNATLIPDQAEVWIALKSSVTSISAWIPTSPTIDPTTLGWSFCGLVDNQQGIALDPSIEIKKYDAFGHPKFRVKLKNGDLTTAFKALEKTNAAVKQIVLPGSAANKIGFLSNTAEEALLKKPEQRQKIAEALYKGIVAYVDTLSHPQQVATKSGQRTADRGQ